MARLQLAALVVFWGCGKDPPAAPPVAALPSASVTSIESPPQPPPPSAAPTEHRPVITTREEMVLHVGQLVTLDGIVDRSKMPTLLGADIDDVDSLGHDSRGKHCQATGILEKSVVTQKEIDDDNAKHGPSARRGAGTYYALVRKDRSGLATPIPKSP